MRGDESNMIVNKQNELQRSNMIWDGTKTGPPFLMRMIEDVDLALKELEIVYRAHGAAIEGLED